MSKKADTVLVIGGGIAGIQAALDLADSGIKVALVERTPSLGGRMGQLDKTFPTNDCSMCILSPKLVAAGRHPNITLYTKSELKSLEGKIGEFTATITKEPRHVSEEKCTACGLCKDVCPVEMESEYDMGMNKRKAIYIPFPQSVPLKYVVYRRGTPPCQAACPAGVHAQAYIALISRGRFGEALEVHREYNPLPLICGRVCPHPCEDACNRGEVDEPISIAALKRFMADYELSHGEEDVEPFQRTSDKRIAVIGSGPAGLTAAYFLTKLGHAATIFEALPRAGGMMAVGIPDYRLPRDILESEIDYIKKKGTEIELNKCFGRDFGLETLKNDGFDAVFLAIGAHASKKLRIPGEDLEGVIPGVEFLRKTNLGEDVRIGKRVAVIGGGDVAIDSVRAASRMGSEAFILYRRTRSEMPAHETEIAETEKEGIDIHYLTQPVKILEKEGKVAGVECIRMELGEPDESGRRRPVPMEGSEFTVEADCIMAAIGQEPDLGHFKDLDLNLTRTGTIVVDENTHSTNIPGVFAAGDAVSGPATVVRAVGAGKKAALAIDAFLKGEEFAAEPEPEDVVSIEELGLDEDFATESRVESRELPVPERKANFNEVVGGLTEEEALQESKRCLNCGGCSGCYKCITACEPGAIDFSHVEQDIDLEVSSVLVVPGFDHIDPETRSEYGYRTSDNVVTALEFERILSASGPFSGHIRRISDGMEPKKIAFIQCVGSRDRNRGMGYCSAVCCMYAIKEAIIAKEHTPDLDVTIFHMDVRAFGKEFDYYYERAQDMGIRFVRCRVADIREEEKGDLTVNFVDEGGEPAHETFDMAVLSNGIAPPDKAEKLGQALGITLDTYGFCKTSSFHPLEAERPGVYVAGAFSEPKDIPDTVAQASGAVAKASAVISSEGHRKPQVESFPRERDVAGEEPRIGVFVCHCGINIGKTVDVPDVVEYAKTLPDVAYVEENLYTCSTDTQELIKEKIVEHKLNRVIVASCSPRTHEPLFQDTVREAELNPYLFEMANIRDQCSWVHMNEPELATDKAKDLVRMAVANARLLRPLYKSRLPVKKAGLIIGGGLSGMTAALELAAQGYEAHLVEREPVLGGNLRNLFYTIQGEDVKEHMEALISAVEGSDMIHVYKQAEVTDVEGHIGDFMVALNLGGEALDVNVGTVTVATGGIEYKPREYLYGKHANVMTQMEFEQKLAADEIGAKNILMIQCVGSRNQERPYCSRVCCTHAVKNALKMKERNPDTEIQVLFKDMRTYGFREEYYSDASEKGVKFFRYDDDNKPVVDTTGDGGLRVVLSEPVVGDQLVFEPDILVLSAAILPQPDNDTLSKLLKAQLSRDRFFLEAHMKLRPVDFSTEGMFLCGLAHSPKFINESISQAAGTVARACTILSKDHLEVGGVVSEVETVKCTACLTCVHVCPYNVPEVGPSGAATIDAAECQGCGICASECPTKAIQLRHYTDEQIVAKCEALFKEGS